MDHDQQKKSTFGRNNKINICDSSIITILAKVIALFNLNLINEYKNTCLIESNN